MEKVPFQGERIRNLVLYFVNHLRDVGNTKLCKLLYFLDQEAYVKTGFTVTGLDYHVLERGPAPLEVVRDIQEDPGFTPEFTILSVIKRSTPRKKRFDKSETFLVPKRGYQFDPEYFSEFELELMERVLEKYGKMSGAELSNATHVEGSPWHDALEIKGPNSLVDFDVDMKLYTDTEQFDKRKYVQSIVNKFKKELATLC